MCTVYIYITILSCYYNLDVSRNNTNLILNRCECNFQLQILHFLKNVLHPFMLSKGVFQKKKVICPDWTCNYSKDKLTTLESKSFACIIYILPSKCCLVKKAHLQGTPYFTWKHDWNLRQDCCIPTNFWEDHASWKDLYFLQWIVYCIFVNM